MLFIDLITTFLRVLSWTLLSWLGALLMGFACYRSRLISHIILPLVNFMRHVSPFCWLPLIIIAAGIGEIAVGITLLISMLFHGVIVTMEMLKSLPRVIVEQALLDGAAGGKLLRHIEIPLSIGGIIDLFRVLWGVGWSAVIAAEMLGVSTGMGYRLLDFRYLMRYPEMMGYIAVIGTIGIVSDQFLLKLRSRYAVSLH